MVKNGLARAIAIYQDGDVLTSLITVTNGECHEF